MIGLSLCNLTTRKNFQFNSQPNGHKLSFVSVFDCDFNAEVVNYTHFVAL